MLTTETALRLIVIGQEVLIAAVLLSGRGSTAARGWGAMLVLSVAAYLVSSDALLHSALGPLMPPVVLLAMLVPYCLWAFARAFFEAPWPGLLTVGTFVVIGLAAWLVVMTGEYTAVDYGAQANLVLNVVKLLVVLHTLWMTVRGRPDDLVERRRAFRTVFVWLIAIQVFAVLSVEIVFSTSRPPAWLDLLNVLVIAAMTLGLAVAILRPSVSLFPPATDDGDAAVRAPVEGLSDPADELLRRSLIERMEDGQYRETGLTIGALAAHMKVPEHQLRHLINGQLGFRNFSAFINSYRIRDAKAKLADPANARLPVLTVALDLGYGSLGPFNRAFKAETGTTPTEFRRDALSRRIADSG